MYADDLLIVAEGRRFLGSIVLVLWALELVKSLEWVPCEMNREADALSNGKFDGFSQNLRVQPDRASWVVLDRLMTAGAAFHVEAKIQRAAAAAGPKTLQDRPRRGDARRIRDPW